MRYPYQSDLLFTVVYRPHHAVRHNPPTRPGMLEIIATCDPVDIQDLPCEVNTGDLPALERGRVYLCQPNPSSRHKLLPKGSLSVNTKFAPTQQAHQLV